MKRFLFLTSIMIIIVCTTITAHAQITADILANYATPTGDFADISDTGYGVSGEAFFSLPLLPIKIGGRVGYENFSGKDGIAVGDISFIDIQPSIRYQLGLPLNLVSFWAQFGAGMYQWKTDDSDGSDMGISAGVGVSVMIAPSVNIVAMPMYHNVMIEGDNFTYITANVGLQF